MIQQLWNRWKKFFLPDIIFFGVVLLFLLLGLILFFLSHLGRGLGLGSAQPLLLLDIPLPKIPSDPVFTLHKDAIQWLNQPKSIFDFTDPGATYSNTSVKQFWLIFLFIADLMMGFFIVLAGYQVIFAGLSSRYGEALESLPNLIFAAIGAHISLIFAQFWIDLNNLLCNLILTQVYVDSHPMSGFAAFITGVVITIITIPILILLVILIIILGIQMATRLGIIIFLTALLPVLFALLALDQTRRFGQAGLFSYVTGVLLQFLQLACIALGAKVLVPFLSANIGPTDGIAPVATILAGIALLWITLRIPGLLRQWALQPIADSGKAASSVFVKGVARLMRLH